MPASRRSFLKSSAAAVGGSWAVFSAPVALSAFELACTNRAENRFSVLSESEAKEIEALTALIVPSDDIGPGAIEAGAVWYIDALLVDSAEDQDFVRAGLEDLESSIAAQGYAGTLSSLTPTEQLAVATAIQDTEFFEELRSATITGMFADPRHGGNRDKLGWQLIGFDDRHAWQPPFGHYDAPYHENPSSGT